MSELTDADDFEVAEATIEQTISGDEDITDEVSVNHWTEKGERLYVNGWRGKLDKYSLYVDLETETARCGNDAWEDKLSVEVEGDEIHVVCDESKGTGPSEKVHELTIRAEGVEDNDDAEEKKIACDGGQTTEEITDEDIEAAIESNDDPDHPDAYSVEEVRDVLEAIQADILDFWSDHQDAIDDEAYEVVHDDRDVVVWADHTGQFWNEQFDAMQLGDEHGILQSIVIQLHHEAARGRCDYSWSANNPVVVEKPESFRAGEQQVLREIARRTKKFGSVARAVDTLATDVPGWSKSGWARLTGRNPSTVTRTTDN